MNTPFSLFLLLSLILFLTISHCFPLFTSSSSSSSPSVPFLSSPSSTWAVLVSTSRYWFNYRHVSNVLSLYRLLKSNGIPDSQIILMIPDEVSCDPRNGHHIGKVFNELDKKDNIYSYENWNLPWDHFPLSSSSSPSPSSLSSPLSSPDHSTIEVDYRGLDVTLENFLRLLTNRPSSPSSPRSSRLLSDSTSNVLIYMTGHGGDEFLKFQDQEEMAAQDFAYAIHQMNIQKRYKELLIIIDTCQAETMNQFIEDREVIAIGSSLKGENSYSYLNDNDIGVSTADRFTMNLRKIMEREREREKSYYAQKDREKEKGNGKGKKSNSDYKPLTMGELMDQLKRTDLMSTPSIHMPQYHLKYINNNQNPHLNNSSVDKKLKGKSQLKKLPVSHFFSSQNKILTMEGRGEEGESFNVKYSLSSSPSSSPPPPRHSPFLTLSPSPSHHHSLTSLSGGRSAHSLIVRIWDTVQRCTWGSVVRRVVNTESKEEIRRWMWGIVVMGVVMCGVGTWWAERKKEGRENETKKGVQKENEKKKMQ